MSYLILQVPGGDFWIYAITGVIILVLIYNSFQEISKQRKHKAARRKEERCRDYAEIIEESLNNAKIFYAKKAPRKYRKKNVKKD